MVQSAVVRYAKKSTVTVIINVLELKIGDVYNTIIIIIIIIVTDELL